MPPLVFEAAHFTAPRHAEASRSTTVAYDEILSIDLQGRARLERLVIGTRRGLLVLARHAFVDPDALPRVLKELDARIAGLPQGGKVFERIGRRRKVVIAAMASGAEATNTIVGALALVFGLEVASGILETPLGLVRFGANVPVLVRQGEIYRLLGSVLLHATAMHLYFNAIVFFFVGTILERLIGRSRFLIVLVMSALASSIASVMSIGQVAAGDAATLLTSNHLYTLGTSGAVLGVVGAAAVVRFRFGAQLPASLVQPFRWWPAMAFGLLAMALALVEVSFLASLVGLATGAVVALLVTDSREIIDPLSIPSPALRYTGTALAVLFAVSAFVTLAEIPRQGRSAELRLAREIVSDTGVGPVALNELAWRIAVDAHPTADELKIALEAADRAVTLVPSMIEAVDTLAAVKYRSGLIDEAVALEHRVLETGASPWAAEHMVKFLEARLRDAKGTARVGFSIVEKPTPAGATRPALIVRLDPNASPAVNVSAKGAVCYVLVQRDQTTIAILRAKVGKGPALERQLIFGPDTTTLPNGVSYRPAFVAPGCERCASGDGAEASLVSVDLIVGDLP